MRYGRTLTLYRADGTAVRVREFRSDPGGGRFDGFITDGGEVIYVKDEGRRVFWSRDAREDLYLSDPSRR